MKIFSKEQLEKALDYPVLIEALKQAFQKDYTVPSRHHHNYSNPKAGIDSTLLLMPAWESGKYLGVKMVTVSPNNGVHNLPAIQGIYTLFDAHKGVPLAMMDAKLLTARRTAATSALAADYLAPQNSKTLLMIGTGALAPELIRAHQTIRRIEKTYVWGRSFAKAKKIEQGFQKANINVEAIEQLEKYIDLADIISCATLSKDPLIKGALLSAATHVDLVGSYLPEMREADDEVIIRGEIFVDTYTGACEESGDILIPIKKGILEQNDIKADLFELCRKEKEGRINKKDITVFKSVGHALEDLAAAKMIYESSI